ncbi:hypothetical protein H0H81_009289 [Sphagnurus paluster]|uniref:Uncharacterized protein n=1 Tax=Sphagnurus paluster TaxID=117069 RepID=A0A9P7GVS4_9AGAR|nr:hypothetical protein H0H81_009289 [Sphagnurus paluster]
MSFNQGRFAQSGYTPTQNNGFPQNNGFVQYGSNNGGFSQGGFVPVSNFDPGFQKDKSTIPSSVNFAASNVVTNLDDAIQNLQFFLNIDTFEFDGETGYLLRPPANNAPGPATYKIAIGPVEISVTIDKSTQATVLKVFLHIPILGCVTVGSLIGYLKDGNSLDIGYPQILGGKVGIRTDDLDVVFSWDFKALGKNYTGTNTLYRLEGSDASYDLTAFTRELLTASTNGYDHVVDDPLK